MSTTFVNRTVPTPTYYRPTSYVPQTAQRVAPNVKDDYERWYTESTPNNRMMLSLRSGIHTEIGWALDRLCRLCNNEQFLLKSIPGLTDALFEWPEWYAREGHKEVTEMQSLFSPDPNQKRRRKHAQESMFVLRNSGLNEPNAAELIDHPRTLPLLLLSLKNVKHDTDSSVEFLLNVIELLHTVSSKVSLPSLPLSENPLLPLQEIANRSTNRSLIIASLQALELILSNPLNMRYLTSDSSALQASLRYLPLFSDKPLIDACLNYLYIHLSYPTTAKAFLLHPDMPSSLRLLVSFLLSEQVEETVYLDLSGPVHTVPSQTVIEREHELSKEELDMLLEKPEPERCFEWMKIMFTPKADGQLTQVDFWNLYKDVFFPYQDRHPALVASDVIKNVNVVFPQAQAMVLPGPPQKFVVRGVDRRREIIHEEKFKCQWDRSQCLVAAFDAPGDLYEHLLEHISHDDGSDSPCSWSSCPYLAPTKSNLRRHILTHLSTLQPIPKHPSQSDNITLSLGLHPFPTATPTSRPPPPPPQTIVTYPRPIVDPPTSALTALLCIRVLFRTSFASTEAAPRADADHFGFPGAPDDDAEDPFDDSSVGITDSELTGERRGRKAFSGVRRLMEGVRIRDEVLFGWILEMIDAGLS